MAKIPTPADHSEAETAATDHDILGADLEGDLDAGTEVALDERTRLAGDAIGAIARGRAGLAGGRVERLRATGGEVTGSEVTGGEDGGSIRTIGMGAVSTRDESTGDDWASAVSSSALSSNAG